MGFDVDAYEPLTAELRGSGALTEAEARQTRLDYADRLDGDVRRRGRARSDRAVGRD
jgi:hypothetical protein